MSITSTAPGRFSGNEHNGNGNGHSHSPNGHRATAPAPAARPAALPGNGRGVIQAIRDLDAAERQHTTPPQSPIGAFSAEQLAALAAPLDRSRIASRKLGGSRVSYLPGWVLIEEANRIFGFDGWQRQTLFCRCAAQAERLIGANDPERPAKPGWGVTYIARVRITVLTRSGGLLIREGTGAGHGIDVDLGQAHESAIKEAETDAMKRALVTFGNPFGLALYDKSQRQVSSHAAPAAAHGSQNRGSNGPSPANGVVRRPQATAPNPVAAAFNGPPRPTTAAAPSPATQRPAAPAQATQRPAPQPVAAAAPDAPLDPPTIRSLHERIRGLLPPQLAAFSQAFRRAFQVPSDIPTIAELITQKRHQLWIQRYLNQAQSLSQGQGQLQARAA
jgi:hypothetical protein